MHIASWHAIYANMKSAKSWHGKSLVSSGCGQTGPTVLAGDKERRPTWSDPASRRKNNGQMKKKCALCQNSRVQLLTALMLTEQNANDRKWQHVAATLHGRHTANHQLAVWYGCQSSRSAIRPFGIPTWSRSNRQSVQFLYIDNNNNHHHHIIIITNAVISWRAAVTYICVMLNC